MEQYQFKFSFALKGKLDGKSVYSLVALENHPDVAVRSVSFPIETTSHFIERLEGNPNFQKIN